LEDGIKKNVVGRAYGTYRRQKRCIQSFGKNLRKGEPLEGLGVDGRIILKWILNKRYGETWTGLIWLRIGTGSVYL
jgi:hypothetical protein